jgi:hypothetical protein
MRAVITTPSVTDTIEMPVPASVATLVPSRMRVPAEIVAPDYETRALEQAAVQLVLRIAEVIRLELDEAPERDGRRRAGIGNAGAPIDVDQRSPSRLGLQRVWLAITPRRRWPEVQHA